MFIQYGTEGNEKHTIEEESQFWAKQLERDRSPYSERLHAYLDRRIVGNLTATIASLVQTRTELTLWEVGSAMCGPEHAVAGAQRLQRALHHQGWESKVIEEVLWEEAETSRTEMEQRGETPLCIWESSVRETPESATLEGWCAVRSSRVRRLARSGYGHGPWRWRLWMHRVRVVVRWKKGHKLIDASGQARKAWEMAFPYVRRWKIAERFRWQKTELQIESLRLHDWEPRRTRRWLVTLAYGFLLSLLTPSLLLARSRLCSHWCQRADWRLGTAKVPLYRLRWALSRLWQTHPPRLSGWQP